MLTGIALLLPLFACGLLGWRLYKEKANLKWEVVVCFAAMSVACSLLLLLVAGEIEFFRYGETQVNRKLDEIKVLTEQNKHVAKATAELVASLASTPLTADKDRLGSMESLRPGIVELLRAAGLSESEAQAFIDRLKKSDPTTSPP
jgi:hypothetical protein